MQSSIRDSLCCERSITSNHFARNDTSSLSKSGDSAAEMIDPIRHNLGNFVLTASRSGGEPFATRLVRPACSLSISIHCEEVT